MHVRPIAATLAFSILSLASVRAADDVSATVLERLDARSDAYAKVALQIWDWAELGFQETKSSALLQRQLAEAGFRMRLPQVSRERRPCNAL